MTNEMTDVRVIVFIDGNNLYHRLRERSWKTWIDIGSLAERVAGNRKLKHIYYYNAYPPGGKSHAKKGNEFLAQVKSTPSLTFRPSWLQPTTKNDERGKYDTFNEKGGDTSLATDLTWLAAKNEFDVAIIVSNDGDYAPTARRIKEETNNIIEVIYFEGSKPFAVEPYARMRVFRKSFLREYDRDSS